MTPAQHVCNYALLRFLPYPETGEFVNVGVMVHGADLPWSGFRVSDDDVRRVTQFFPAVSVAAYLRQRKTMCEELERVRALLMSTNDQRLARSIFQDLVKPRESVFRFGETRTAMTDDPTALLTRLCEQYVKPKRSVKMPVPI